MSGKRLKIWIFICVVWLFLYAGFYTYVKYYDLMKLAMILETLLPIVLAIPATFLAAGLSRRNSYLQALRDLWHQIIPAVQVAIQYTYLTSPNQEDFVKTQKALLSSIDMLRGVFRNVPTPGRNIGLYPYENIKDIEKLFHG